ncbi:MAG: decaprenyl-phosphate phosphoribosyltransferase [Pseudohongiellaceae bacterium]|jgi:decaprenyl-phosphate phosphoribosyltransferase
MTDIKSLIKLARPRHWVKNALVLVPVPFALASGAVIDEPTFALGLIGFCLVNSAIYAFNDTNDAALDRQHPSKMNRPVASGRVSAVEALTLSFLLLVTGQSLCWASGHDGVLTITSSYVVINIIYCLWGRSVALLDAYLLSSGYVLRVLLGCALLGVTASNWLLLCASTLAFFLGLAKRRSDVVSGIAHELRPSLRGYNISFLDQAIGITAALALMSYAIYCMEAEVLLPGREFATIPFAAFGVLEYLRAVHVKGEGGSPVDLALSSPVLILSGLGWIAATFWSLDL